MQVRGRKYTGRAVVMEMEHATQMWEKLICVNVAVAEPQTWQWQHIQRLGAFGGACGSRV